MATATTDSEMKVKIGKMIFYITCVVVVDLNWRPMFWQDPEQALRVIPVL